MSSRNPTDYTRPAAAAHIAKIVALLERGPATTTEIIAATGLSAGRAREFMQHMAVIGQIVCTTRAEFSFKGSKPAIWSLSPDFDPEADQDCERRVVVRTSWTPNHARMAMDCLLFGVPAAMQGRMA